MYHKLKEKMKQVQISQSLAAIRLLQEKVNKSKVISNLFNEMSTL